MFGPAKDRGLGVSTIALGKKPRVAGHLSLPGLTESERRDAIGLVRRAVAMDQWRLDYDATYTVTGAPVAVPVLADAVALPA